MSIYESRSTGASDEVTLNVTVENHSLELAPPVEFNGPGGFLTPEDLFSASISSCYILTFKSLAAHKKLPWLDIDVKAIAHLEKTSEGLKFTKVDILSKLFIESGDIEVYKKLLMRAKDLCLVTNSMNCLFTVFPEVEVI